jgi:phage gp45-like
VKVQQYGFSFHAPPGAEGVVINMNGSRDNPMVIGVEMPDQRPTGMPEGGVRVYDGSGSYVDFNNGGTVTIKCDKLVIDCPDINLGGEGGVPASKEGTIDTGGFADVSSLSTRVKII